jgi:hypothetical protein
MSHFKFEAAKSVAVWPRSKEVDDDFASRAGWSWLISNLLFPTLFVIHWAYIGAGYKMDHKIDARGLSITYRPGPVGKI